MEWPAKKIELHNGWSYDGKKLAAPDGRKIGPDDLLSIAEITQLRGNKAVSTPRRMFKSDARKIGAMTVVPAAIAVEIRPVGPPRKKP